MQRLLITGASGFIGKALVSNLLNRGFKITASYRKLGLPIDSQIKSVVVGDLSSETDWTHALERCDIVIHLAARVHVMKDKRHDPLAAFRRMNVEATLHLAQQAIDAGVKRFIYISSIKAAEASASQDKTLDPYGVSKYEAEQVLLTLAKQRGLEVVIIRPPLVYGSGVKGNFLLLLRYMYKSIPLPLGAIHNQRSFIALENLVDFIIHTLAHPKAINQTLSISDGCDLSTTELLKKIANVLDKKAYLIPVPEKLLLFVLTCLGKKDMADRLMGSLQVDSSKAGQQLGWKPVITMDEQLKKMAETDLK